MHVAVLQFTFPVEAGVDLALGRIVCQPLTQMLLSSCLVAIPLVTLFVPLR